MSVLKSSLVFGTLLVCGIVAHGEVALKVVRGERDTVYSKKHYVVAVTDAGNSATINGEPAKVYKTGSFGAEIMLQEGNNAIEIIASNGAEKAVKRMNVFYAANRPERLVSMEKAKKEIERSTLKARDLYAKSKQGAYMQYGDGDDRLGGSKMGFVDEDIVFKVVGEIGDLYKVQLSETRYAYVPVEYLEVCEGDTKPVNTGSWYVGDAGQYDRVSISLPKRLPYHSWVQLDPTTICVDIFGAMNNSNWMTQLNNTKMVDYVDFRQVESDVYRVIIKLKHEYAWGYSVGYEGKNLVITVKHTPNLTLKGLVVGLDAGHGGKYPGAISPSGLTEKEVNMSIINEIKTLLEAKGAKVVLSRDGDVDVSMGGRKKIFKDANVDLMISVHNNSGGSPLNEMGSCTAYKHISNRALAVKMQEKLLELGHKNFGVIGNFNFSLNGPTEYPNVLLEVLFMSSLPEEEKLADVAYRKKIAKQVVAGLEEYLKDVKGTIK